MSTGRADRRSGLERAALVTVGGVRTRSIQCLGGGPTVLLLHGFSDSADGWREVMQHLAGAGRHAVALDLPHFGRAERPASEAVLPILDDFVDAAIGRYDTGGGVVLVGNSIGGLAALRAAQRLPHAVAAVIAIGPAGLHVPRWMKVVHRVRPITDRVLTLPVPSMIRGSVLGPALISTVFAHAVASRPLRGSAKAQYASHWGPGDLRRQLLLGGRTITEMVRGDVVDPARCLVPVTLVWGDGDWICPPKKAGAARPTRPGVRVRRLRGSGHCPQYDRADAVAALINQTVLTSTAGLARTAEALVP